MTDDPFATLGLDRRFDLDADELRRRFLALSAEAHPDRYTDPLEQADAVERMAKLTEAYRVLLDPELRAKALLHLSGLEADSDQLPPDLLMEVMEVREELESAIENKNIEELSRLSRWATQRHEAHLQQIGALFANTLDANAAASVQLELNALRYMQRILEQLPN